MIKLFLFLFLMLATLLPAAALADGGAGAAPLVAVSVTSAEAGQGPAPARFDPGRPEADDPRKKDRQKARRALLAAMLAVWAGCDGSCPTLAFRGN